MAKPNRTLAFLAYLVPLLGPLAVLLFNRKNLFAVYHACQALALLLIAILAPLLWGVTAWLVTWVPFAGVLLGASLFALVITVYIAILIAWVAGLVNSLRGQIQPVPILGGWGDQLYARLGSS